jgi:hypothetical protein
VGVDFAWDWEQEKLEAREMFVNRAESPASSARFVGRFLYINITDIENGTTNISNRFLINSAKIVREQTIISRPSVFFYL